MSNLNVTAPAKLRALADAADVAPNTLVRYLANLPVQPRIRRRIEAALASRPELAPTARAVQS